MTKRDKCLAILDRSLLAGGVVLLSTYATVQVYRSVSSRLGLLEFDHAQAAAIDDPTHPLQLGGEEEVDFRLWSTKRVQGYRQSLTVLTDMPLAVIRIEKVNLRVPVFEGTDEWALNRGAGWITGTARPGEKGNAGFAGHRDGFFRKLKDVSLGDAIELATKRDKAMYTVDQIEIVAPDDVSVLRPRALSSLTLVTCYPFYFVGAAPRRYILHASLKERVANGALENGSPQREPDYSIARRLRK